MVPLTLFLIALGLWMVDAAVGTFLFDEGTWWEVFITAIPRRSLIVRLTSGFLLMVPGVVLAWLHARRDRVNALLYSDLDLVNAVMESVSDVIFVKDRQGRILLVNDAGARVFGLAKTALIGRRLEEIAPAAIAARVLADDREVLDRGRDISREITLPVGDRSRTYSIRKHPYTTSGGEIAGVVGVAHDITERSQAEAALREREQRLEQIITQMPYPVEVCRPDGTASMVNQAFLDMFEIPSPESVVDAYNVFEDPLVMEELNLATSIRRAYEGETVFVPEITIPYDQIDPSYGVQRQRPLVHEATMFPVLTPAGEIWRVVTIWKDITERKHAEEDREALLVQVRRQARRLQQILDTVPAGVFLLDARHRVALANPAAQRYLDLVCGSWFGDPLDRLGDRSLDELLSPPGSEPWHEIKADGRTFVARAGPVPGDDGGESWVVVMNDVTREREMQEASEQQARLAAVGQLAAGVAHDFNNVLAVIVLHSQLALYAGDLTDKLRERLEIILSESRRAAHLIEQILDFGRRCMLERRPLDLVPFMQASVKLLRHTLPESVVVDLVHDAGPLMVSADATRLQQVMMNLAVNARDAMPEGGRLTITLRSVQIGAAIPLPVPGMATGRWVSIAVTDTGTGIPEDVLPHIFEPFFTTKKTKGSGLGLAQVHGLVLQHDGKIDVQTGHDEGTTMTIYLPMLPGTTEPDPHPTLDGTSAATVPEGRGETILLVEDDATVRRGVAEILATFNYRVVQAAHGRAALDLLEGETPPDVDLVLSDLIMPVMGGEDLLRALRARSADLPVLMLSGHALDKRRAPLEALGLTGWISKPPDPDELLRLIAEALAART
jgi:PAS domain S-box-containing protein